MNVLFHHSERENHQKVISNVQNLLDDDTVGVDEVAVVTNAGGIELLMAGSDLHEEIRELSDQGVLFKACGNTLSGSDIGQDGLIEGVEVVSSGVGELTRLQDQEYGYIKP